MNHKLKQKVLRGEALTELEEIELDISVDKFTRQKSFDEIQGIIYCWNCGRTLQKPQMFQNIKSKGKGTSTFKMKCMCGETTEVKF